MTDRPYTDEDLRAEAARQHTTLTEDPDFGSVGERMDHREVVPGGGVLWRDFSDDTYELAQNAVADLINGAADVSEWAVRLGEAGLRPQEPMAWFGATTGWELAVQVATNPDIKDDVREELLREIRAAVDTTVKRVLKAKDAGPKQPPMDPVHILGIDTAEDDGDAQSADRDDEPRMPCHCGQDGCDECDRVDEDEACGEGMCQCSCTSGHPCGCDCPRCPECQQIPENCECDDN